MQFTVETSMKDAVIDLTDLVQEKIRLGEVKSGLCHLFLLHTTCALTTADLDPGTDKDLLDALRHMIPILPYRHPHDPSHAPDHILSSIIGPSILIPFEAKNILLGSWQRIVLVELDGPRRRTINILLIKTE